MSAVFANRKDVCCFHCLTLEMCFLVKCVTCMSVYFSVEFLVPIIRLHEKHQVVISKQAHKAPGPEVNTTGTIVCKHLYQVPCAGAENNIIWHSRSMQNLELNLTACAHSRYINKISVWSVGYSDCPL